MSRTLEDRSLAPGGDAEANGGRVRKSRRVSLRTGDVRDETSSASDVPRGPEREKRLDRRTDPGEGRRELIVGVEPGTPRRLARCLTRVLLLSANVSFVHAEALAQARCRAAPNPRRARTYEMAPETVSGAIQGGPVVIN
jgi:hypothetical protein